MGWAVDRDDLDVSGAQVKREGRNRPAPRRVRQEGGRTWYGGSFDENLAPNRRDMAVPRGGGG